MTSITTLRTNVWDYINTYLETKGGSTPISTTNIHAALNDALVKAEGYPQVIIFPPACSFEKVTANGKIVSSNVSVLIEIYNVSSQTVKSLTDEVIKRLLDGRYWFAGKRLMSMELTEGDYDAWMEGQKKIHRIGFQVEFRYVEDYSPS